MLQILTRECIDDCYYGCRPKGVGVTTETCAECCNENGCNKMYPLSGRGTNQISSIQNSILISGIIMYFNMS